jgi:hypothetical protein
MKAKSIFCLIFVIMVSMLAAMAMAAPPSVDVVDVDTNRKCIVKYIML